MGVSAEKLTIVGNNEGYSTNPPTVKEIWTVSGGNYAPKFKVRGFILQKAGSTEAAIAAKFKDDDTSDIITLATNVVHPGSVISALQTGTTATSVVFLG